MNEPTRSAPVDRGAVLIPFVIEVHARFTGPDTRLPTTAYAPAVEIALQSIVARLFNGGERSRQLLRGYVAAVADRPQLDDRRHLPRLDEIFWELSDNHGPHSTYLLSPLDARLRRMLEGEPSSMQIGFWALQSGEFPPVRIQCELLEFSDGSLKGRIKGFVSGTVVFITLLCAAGSTPFGKEIHDRVVIKQTMSSIYAGEPCVTEALLTIKAPDLLDATATEFNFKAHGLSEGAHARRVCLVQLATNLDGQSPGPIDGMFGPKSQSALDAFKQKHNLKREDVTDVELQRELAKAFHKGLRDMAR